MSDTSEDISPAGLPVAVQSLQTVLGKCQKGGLCDLPHRRPSL